jgi:glycosyltransferase involved in cell wall biosynthesis
MGHKLSIVIPVYNEVGTLAEIIRQVQAVEIGIEKEIVLVDDCSTDGARELLQRIEASGDASIRVFYHDVNRGKGAALRTGFQHVDGDMTLVQDSDLEYDPRDYPKLIGPILSGAADAVYGSRFKTGRGDALLSSYAANRFLTSFSNLVTGLNLTDIETCYKAIKTSILREIPLRSDRFGFEPEITAKLAKRKCRICEVPITYRGRDYHEGKKVGWKDGLAAMCHIVRFRFMD